MKRNFWNLWVALHWLMAVLVITTFFIGLVSLNSISSPEKKWIPLGWHLVLGGAILLLVLARLAMRVWVYNKPLFWSEDKNQTPRQQFILDKMDKFVHPLLYFGTILMAALGIAISLPARLPAVIFFGSEGSIPADFSVYPARAWHGAFSTVLMLLVFQHILVAVFHQFIKKDNFIKRMWFKGTKEQ